MKPDSRLLEKLVVARYRLHQAKASVGVGDRQSSAKGAGMEFASHRPYREGDDVRNLDPRLMARLGEPFVREYFVDRQLPVYVILDGSASMQQGKPGKFETAAMLAQVLGFVALASGDQVRIGVTGNAAVDWSPRLQGQSRADMLFDWVGGRRIGGKTSFSTALRQARGVLTQAALVILISDFMDEGVERELKLLTEGRHDMIAIHMASPQEIDPSALGGGPVTLRDAESGEAIDMSLNPTIVARYREVFSRWQSTLRDTMTRAQGRYFFLSSSADLEQFISRDLRGRNVFA
ncbi:DUF58 domain-containing protein [Paradevosia shaoguanensis]|uniref:DUF58 domain-containing protein n=1 Tax=Paradevosia shaoguanensis TaxID=1335043 RepID=UPI001933D370|nr:DUF58 domain-containing protein [Paradevosia shaoguanensis]